MSLVSQERAGQDDEFAHDRRQRHLGGLSGGEPGLVLGLQIRIEASCYQGWLIQRLMHIGAATPDRASATRGPAVMGHRSQASEACHLTVIETAQFRHVDEQAQSCGLCNAGNAHEDRQARGEIRIFHAQTLEVRIDGSDSRPGRL